jgi:hypothetical protein
MPLIGPVNDQTLQTSRRMRLPDETPQTCLAPRHGVADGGSALLVPGFGLRLPFSGNALRRVFSVTRTR